MIIDIIKSLIGCLRFVLAEKTLVTTDELVLHFHAWFIVETQKTQASLKGQRMMKTWSEVVLSEKKALFKIK